MNTAHDRHTGSQRGFSLIEVLIAMMIPLIVMASVMMLLQKGQTTFQREPEVADMNQNARTGLDMISRDLTMAGLNTPPPVAIMWINGGGDTPDELTIVYADPEFPTITPVCNAGGSADATASGPIRLADLGNVLRSRRLPSLNLWRNPFALHVSASFLPAFFGAGGNSGGGNSGGGNSGGGGCGTLERSSTIFADVDTFNPPQAVPTDAFGDGQVLFAIETMDCDSTGDGTAPNGLGIVPFELTQDPGMSGGSLRFNHNPGQSETDLNHPGGFNGEVHPDCSIIGVFRVIQYRINPLPPADNPNLERRDLSITGEGGQWFPVAMNVENLQVQFAVGGTSNFEDDPAVPDFADPTSWITQVSVEVDATSETENLQGASQGVFADGNRLRRTFRTTVSLRNQQNAISVASFEAGGLGSAENYN